MKPSRRKLRRRRPVVCEPLESRLQLTTLTLSMSAVEVSAKAQTPIVFTFTRDNTVGNLLVNYRVGGDSTAADLTSPLSGSLTMVNGSATATITATPIDDPTATINKTLTIQLEEPDGCGYTLGAANQGTVRLDESKVNAATVRNVGPGKTYATLAAAYTAAVAGDTIDIFANGSSYSALTNSISISKNNLTIRGIGLGRVGIYNPTTNMLSNGKGIILGNVGVTGLKIENLDLEGARVTDANGAGLRMQGDTWNVINCYFYNNENGILASAGGSGVASITYSQFLHNGLTDAGATAGQQHNCYISTGYSQFTFEFNTSSDSGQGHLLKSRARLNYIEYNRMIGTTTESYETSCPDAGKTYIIGNIIEQAANSSNGGIIDYASEHAPQAGDFLYIVNNTVVNNRSAGTFVQSPLCPAGFNVTSLNNIFAGPGTVYNLANSVVPTTGGDVRATTVAAANFVDPANFNYHLKNTSPALNAGINPGSSSDGVSLTPVDEPLKDQSYSVRIPDATLDAGAYDYVDTLPAWLSAGSVATWDPVYKILTVTGAATITANPGSDQPTINGSSAAAVLTIQPNGTAGGPVQVGNITLTSGASIHLYKTNTLFSNVLIVEGSITASAGKIDVTDGGIIVNPQGADPTSGLETLLASGRSTGQWNGTTGITSSTANADYTAHHFQTTAVGIAKNGSLFAQYKTFAGQTVNNFSDLLRYTVMCDADLNGKVDDDDVTILNLYYDNGATTGHHWWQGDFDGNGKVDDDDVTLMGLFYGSSTPTPAAAPAASPALTVASATSTTTTPQPIPKAKKRH